MSEFTGIWMPADVLADDRLTLSEKLLVAYTMSFPVRCFASDEHMGKMLGVSGKTISNRLTLLRKKGILSGRDFPKSGNSTSRNSGIGLPEIREHRYKGDISEKKNMKNNEASPTSEFPDNPEAREKLLGVLAIRGLERNSSAAALDIVMGEIKAGYTAIPGHWPTFMEAFIRKGAKKKAAPVKAPPVSQFSKTY